MGVFSKKITLKNRRSWGRLIYSLTSPLAWGGGRVGVVKPCNVQKRGPGLRENGCLWGPPAAGGGGPTAGGLEDPAECEPGSRASQVRPPSPLASLRTPSASCCPRAGGSKDTASRDPDSAQGSWGGINHVSSQIPGH